MPTDDWLWHSALLQNYFLVWAADDRGVCLSVSLSVSLSVCLSVTRLKSASLYKMAVRITMLFGVNTPGAHGALC